MPHLPGQPIAFVDIVTSGLDLVRDRIVEAAVFVLDPKVTQRQGLSLLVNPDVPLSPAVQAITGLTPEHLATAAGPEALHEVLDLIGDRAIGAFDAPRVAGFLDAEAHRLGRRVANPALCVRDAAARRVPGLASYRLDALCSHLGIVVGDPDTRAPGLVKRAVYLWQALRSGRHPAIAPRTEDPPPESVYAYCQSNGTPFYVQREVQALQGLEPQDPVFRYYVQDRLRGRYTRVLLGAGLTPADARALEDDYLARNATLLLNRENSARRLLVEAETQGPALAREAAELLRRAQAAAARDPREAAGAYAQCLTLLVRRSGLVRAEGRYGALMHEVEEHGCLHQALAVLERLVTLLVGVGRPDEARIKAQAFFARNPELMHTPRGLAILRRWDTALPPDAPRPVSGPS